MASLWFETALLPTGWADRVRIGVAEGKIRTVQAAVDPLPGDERGGAALPGLANLHSHAFQRAMAGLAETRGPTDDDFWTWRETMYRFLAHLGPSEVEAISAFAYGEMLESGFTRVGEFHYLHNDPDGRPYAQVAEMAERVAAGAETAGIGLTLLPVFYAHGGFGGAAPTHGQRRFVTSLDGFGAVVEGCRRAVENLGGAVVGVAPHSLRAVTPDELAAVASLAGEGPIHIHAAEQLREVEDCLAWAGRRPVEWLLDEAGVDHRWCLVHATHLTARETERLASSGAVAGLCPITEANLGDGVFPANAFVDAGGRLGVGTDSNVFIDAAGELRALEYGQRLTLRRRNVLVGRESLSAGRTLFGAALPGGHQALGIESQGLEASAPADIVELDLQHPSLAGRDGDALLDGWIFAAPDRPIHRVWRGGRCVVTRGRHVRREAMVASYRKAIAKLQS